MTSMYLHTIYVNVNAHANDVSTFFYFGVAKLQFNIDKQLNILYIQTCSFNNNY